MSVPFFDGRRELTRLQAPIDAAIRRVMDGGRLILGPEVRAFEEEFAAWTGARYAVGVNSGTDALVLSLRALGVGPGDEVLTVTNAGVPPIAAIREVGAAPRLVDIDPATFNLDPARLEAALTSRCRAVIPVHLYGRLAPVEAIAEFACRHGLPLIEDCAQAHGARREGKHAGTFGVAGCFSFYPTKNLGAVGDGGLVITQDEGLADELRRQRMYGFDGDKQAHVEGINSRLDELQAAILRVKLEHYEPALAQRREHVARYRSALAGADVVLPSDDGDAHAWHLFAVRSANREALARALAERGIGTGVHYEAAVHHMPAYRGAGWADPALPHSEAACAEVLSLPLFNGLTPEEIDRVAEAVQGAQVER